MQGASPKQELLNPSKNSNDYLSSHQQSQLSIMNNTLNNMQNSDPTKPSLADTKSIFMDDLEEDTYSEHTEVEMVETEVTTKKDGTEAVPTVITDTTVPGDEPYVPLLPQPVASQKKRQLIMDTETTGFEYNNGDRIIEVGIVEMVGRKFTGEKLHVYINPDRSEPMSEEVIRVHGITDAFLEDKPKFKDIASAVYDFMEGAEVIAHNASFDMNFLDMEFVKAGLPKLSEHCKVTDSLVIAKNQYPGQRNTLDALVKRLDILTKDRTFHGALLDAEILADVYLAMTGGQVTLSLGGESSTTQSKHITFNVTFAMQVASTEEQQLHTQWLTDMAEKNGNDDFLTNWQLAPAQEAAEANSSETT